MMNWEKAREVIEEAFSNYYGESLKDIQLTLLGDVWQGLSYQQIARKNHLSVNYIRGDLAPKLWHKLSLSLGKKVTKSNFKQVVSNFKTDFSVAEVLNTATLDSGPEEYPPLNDFLAVDSPHYQERVEPLARQILPQPGAFLALQAPQGMGKTHCLRRLTYWAESQGYQTLYLNWNQAEPDALTSWPRLLEWLSFKFANFLNLSAVLSRGLDKQLLGSQDEFNKFLENEIFPRLTDPFLLVLDDVDTLFGVWEIASRFGRMINTWHEQSCYLPPWQGFRILLAYSPESPQFLTVDNSLFRATATLELEDFSASQIDILIQRACLSLTPQQHRELIALVGGHPYLLSQALYALKYRRQSPDIFLGQTSTLGGVYAPHLCAKARQLQAVPELLPLWRRLVWSDRPVTADSLDFRALRYLGLIQWQGNQVVIKNDLYRRFFRQID